MFTEIRLKFANFEFFEIDNFIIGFERAEEGRLPKDQEEMALQYAADALRKKADEIEELIKNG